MKNKVRKKPPAKEMASAIIEINNKVNECYSFCRELDNIFGLYISMKKYIKKFNAYIEKKAKEKDDAKKYENADKPNLQGDTNGESSGAEGVREKAK